ncbi:hypothetical protein G6O69_34420 [Pseudenhygromyxa sp. WMMC2535]|uniref:hypothetical protein n=1 Tax=Pseudenhygromyxa sp. WMMC2535 TaxID=2712867 RepID=UPI0015560357|nr:hypothetical protein [Pseudenhygromyxa sp. WMMC2535]NVB42968.1 hypothetical protein [Pseudenhygromyxa sp. WMMC2535]
MPPAALALIDAVFQLALHHSRRAQSVAMPEHESGSVRAEIRGPLTEAESAGCIRVDVIVTLQPRGGGEPEVRRVDFCIDLEGERLLASSVSLAEIPLDRSGLALLIGELESWCYVQIPVQRIDYTESEDDPMVTADIEP